MEHAQNQLAEYKQTIENKCEATLQKERDTEKCATDSQLKLEILSAQLSQEIEYKQKLNIELAIANDRLIQQNAALIAQKNQYEDHQKRVYEEKDALITECHYRQNEIKLLRVQNRKMWFKGKGMICNFLYLAKQKLKWLILFLVSAFTTSSAFALIGHPYLGGTIGASIAENGNNNPQINYYDGFLTDAYPINGSHPTTSSIGVNGGYEFAGERFLPAIALGLGVYGTPGEYDYKGQLIETTLGDSGSTLYDYKFHIKSMRLMVEAQFTWILEQFAPFVAIGAGTAWNRLSGYTESPIDSTGYVALPPFQSRTNTHFTYQIGLGVGYAFNFARSRSGYQHERISLGYRYVNLGNASFGTRGAVYPYRLSMGRLTTNEIYLIYTHLF